MDDQKNRKPDFSKAGEDSILYKKEEPKTEREKLKELHGKDKIWYLVHYYGLQTIVALAIIGIISFLIINYGGKCHAVCGQSGWGFRLL